jgi:hypothetical protein
MALGRETVLIEGDHRRKIKVRAKDVVLLLTCGRGVCHWYFLGQWVHELLGVRLEYLVHYTL